MALGHFAFPRQSIRITVAGGGQKTNRLAKTVIPTRLCRGLVTTSMDSTTRSRCTDTPNKESGSNGDGYGLIRFNKSTREVTFEYWPREVDVTKPGAKQFPGWPKTVHIPLRTTGYRELLGTEHIQNGIQFGAD